MNFLFCFACAQSFCFAIKLSLSQLTSLPTFALPILLCSPSRCGGEMWVNVFVGLSCYEGEPATFTWQSNWDFQLIPDSFSGKKMQNFLRIQEIFSTLSCSQSNLRPFFHMFFSHTALGQLNKCKNGCFNQEETEKYVLLTACARVIRSSAAAVVITSEIVLNSQRYSAGSVCSDGTLSFWSKAITYIFHITTSQRCLWKFLKTTCI